MPITDKFFTINIRKYLALGDDQEAGCRTVFEKKRHRVYKKEPVCHISGILGHWRETAGIFYPCIKTADGQGRNGEQYNKKKAAACQ